VAHSAQPSRTASIAATEEPSVGALVQSAMADMSTLIRNEIELAKSEVGRSAKKAAVGGAAFAAAGVMAAIAGLFFLVFVAELIAVWLPQWAGFLIVFGALIFLAAIAGLVGLRTMKKIEKPERTMESLRELPEVMRREAPGTRHREVPTVTNGHVELRGDNYVV
jgi:hypothetical protein